MPLEATFDAIYPSVVALASLAVRRDATGESARIPEILGTGFVLDARGVVVTAAHVARALQGQPRHPTHDRPAAVAIVFERPRADGTRVLMKASWVPILTYAHLQTARMFPDGTFHGEVLPDLALVQIGVKGLPPVQLATGAGTIRIGMPVAFAGFSFGSTALHLQFDEGAQPILAQITPFVRHGIVSSVHPFPCDVPHGFTI